MVRTPFYYKNQVHKMDAQMLYFRAVADQPEDPADDLQLAAGDRGRYLGRRGGGAVAASEYHCDQGKLGESGEVHADDPDVKPGFQVLTGSAPTLAPSLAIGARARCWRSPTRAVFHCRIWEAHRSRETAAAMDWQNRILRAAQLVTVKYGVPGLKYAMDLNGYYGGPPRLPLTAITPEAKNEIEQAFDGLKG